MKVVIVGAGQAAATCAFRLREHGFQGEVTILGEEAVHPYQRPPLSKKYLNGLAPIDDLFIRPANSYDEEKINVHLNLKVESVDPQRKEVITQGGQSFPYDKLVFATGSRARPLPGLPSEGLNNVFTFRDLKDADALNSYLLPGKRMVIIGGGYIGLEIAAVARASEVEVAVLERAERILQRVACKETSDFVRHFHCKRGVRIFESAEVERYNIQDAAVSSVLLQSGEELLADVVVVGIGIIPNAEIASAAGVELALDAIKVDPQCRTSVDSIYAIGDCTSFDFHGKTIRLESVQNALEQADTTARDIVGLAGTYAPKPWFWSDQYSYKMQIAGLSFDHDHVVSRISPDGSSASFWYFKGELLQAVDSISDPRAFMLAKKYVGTVVTKKGQLPDSSQDLKTIFS
ncbi:NAD(P)/FAD-dependent oxidoreductase [Pseudomonas kurunegalensis]|uniref:NAD(P)/FAD-dependent oxidoreductase n=1 Tax=Pseudomonas kurunegalensis TaxID=485880 RepID=UPI002570983F|nr:FAD-dependent oxidoreductase [Pseudomonas kurunegalensis]WJD65122.1 FAD-dependent oxidoreductase [Pseudomonas kurunegalensis]